MYHIFKYFFPGLKPYQKLPLLPRQYTSKRITTRAASDSDLEYMKAKAVARSTGDAHRLMAKHTDKKVQRVVSIEKRQRRRENVLARVWRKLQELNR